MLRLPSVICLLAISLSFLCGSFHQVLGQNVLTHHVASFEDDRVGSQLLHDFSGLIWSCTPQAGQSLALSYFDGTKWQPGHEAAVGTALVPEATGRLLLLDRTGSLQTLHVSRRGGVPQELAVLPPNISAVTYACAVSADRLYLETPQGIWLCADGSCSAITMSGTQLLGVLPSGAVYVQDQRVFVAGKGSKALGRLAGDHVTARTQGVHTPGAFVAGDSVYVLEPGIGKSLPSVRQLCAMDNAQQLRLAGRFLLAVAPDKSVRIKALQSSERWYALIDNDLERTGVVEPVVAGLSGASCVSYDRIVLATTEGITFVTRRQLERLAIDLPSRAKPIVSLCKGGQLIISEGSGITVFEQHDNLSTQSQTTYPAEDYLMRYSVPTQAVFHEEALYAGTSDGRVLRIAEGQPATVAVDLRRLGGYVFGLEQWGSALWGCFDPKGEINAGLFRYEAGELTVFGKEEGLAYEALCVRASASGSIFVSAKSGLHLLYRYQSSTGTWTPVGPPVSEPERFGEVHDFFARSDTSFVLATDRGLLEYQPSTGYRLVPLPAKLIGKEVLGVAQGLDGFWFTVDGIGLAFMQDGELTLYESEFAQRLSYYRMGYRGLNALPDGGLVFARGNEVYRAHPMQQRDRAIQPSIRLSKTASLSLPTLFSSGVTYTLSEGDSIAVAYAVPGYSTAQLGAYFELDGKVIQPVRERPGFAMLPPVEGLAAALKISVIQLTTGMTTAVTEGRVLVRVPWYTTGRGVGIIILLIICALGLVSYGMVLRSQRVAQHLERVVAHRTADLHAAQAKSDRASAAKSMFLANMSHELRTPLNAVLGMSDLLAETNLDAQQQEYHSAIVRGGSALATIVSDILDFAEIDSGKIKYREEQTDLEALFRKVSASYGAQAHQQGLFFGYNLAANGQVKTDPSKLRGILSHLLSNAVKFTASGAIHVKTSFEPAPQAGQQVLLLEVSDTGIGIPEAKQKLVFDVFEQADNSATRRHGGTGLGLAVVQAYVDCMGGDVQLRSTVGVGSTFTVRLPVGEVSEEAAVVVPGLDVLPEIGLLAQDKRHAQQLAKELSRLGLCTSFVPKLELLNLPKALICITDTQEETDRLLASREVAIIQKSRRPLGFVCLSLLANVRSHVSGIVELSYPLPQGKLRDWAAEWGAKALAKQEQLSSASASPAKSPSQFFDLASECPLSILVAEDNAVNKMLVLTVLRKLGYRADWAEHGARAVELFAANQYDLILMDVHMPEMDGLEATRILRKRFVDTPPFICALTANASEEGRQECEEAGMNAFLSKPLALKQLIATLRTVPRLGSQKDGPAMAQAKTTSVSSSRPS